MRFESQSSEVNIRITHDGRDQDVRISNKSNGNWKVNLNISDDGEVIFKEESEDKPKPRTKPDSKAKSKSRVEPKPVSKFSQPMDTAIPTRTKVVSSLLIGAAIIILLLIVALPFVNPWLQVFHPDIYNSFLWPRLHFPNSTGAIITTFAIAIVYFVPSFLLIGHRWFKWAFILNLLTGWTIWGWVICLVWFFILLLEDRFSKKS